MSSVHFISRFTRLQILFFNKEEEKTFQHHQDGANFLITNEVTLSRVNTEGKTWSLLKHPSSLSLCSFIHPAL